MRLVVTAASQDGNSTMGIVQLIFLILGIMYLVRIFTIAPLKPEQFPLLPSGVFLQWKNLEVRSIYLFFGATWGSNIVIFIGNALGTANSDSGISGLFGLAGIVMFVVLLIVSAIIGSQSAKIKKQYRDQWQQYAPGTYFPAPTSMTPPQGYVQYPRQNDPVGLDAVPSGVQAQLGNVGAVATVAPPQVSSAVAVAAQTQTDWQCRCGNVNGAEDTVCRKCKRSVNAII